MVKIVSTSLIPREELDGSPEYFRWNEFNAGEPEPADDHSAADEPAEPEPDRKGVRLL